VKILPSSSKWPQTNFREELRLKKNKGGSLEGHRSRDHRQFDVQVNKTEAERE
jgi:hypothetical protein